MNKLKNNIAILLVILFVYKGTAQNNLTKRILLDNQVTIKTPTNFKQLDVNEINQKYDPSRRPSIAFSNTKGNVSLTLDLKPTQITQEDLLKYQVNYGFMFSKYRIDQTKKATILWL